MTVIDSMPDETLGRLAQSLAEKVDPEYAVAAAKRYQTRRRPGGLLLSAWSEVELGMNQQLNYSRDVKDSSFDLAQQLTGEILNNSKINQDITLGAYILSSYLPLFRKRADGLAVETQDCLQIYDSLGAMISHLNPDGDFGTAPWRLSETAVLALSARTGQPKYLLYPTSPREESSDTQHYNHDSYFYGEDFKYQIQQKFIDPKKSYDSSITMLILQPLIDRASRASGLEPCQDAAEQVSRILSLVVCETNGLELDKSETKFLNHMSAAVVAHHAELKRRKPQP